MISFYEFADNRIGNAYVFKDKDCERLVIDGLKDIHGITVNKLTGEDFVECQKSDALFFVCEDDNGVFSHTGLYHKGIYLHAVGTPHSDGQVYAHKSGFFTRVFAAKYKKVTYAKWR